MAPPPMFALPYLTSLFSFLNTSAIDEPIDTLSCMITGAIFVFSAILISAKGHSGSAIDCWIPQTYSGPWEQFAENYCFLKDTYWYPTQARMDMHISDDHKQRYRLKYYQWSSMYLTVAAMFFLVPKLFWQFSLDAVSMPVLYFCTSTKEISEKTPANRVEKIKEMAHCLEAKINAHHSPFSLARIHATSFFVVSKFLYVINSIAQFVFLSYFIGEKDNLFWGFTLSANLLKGVTWETTGLFPRTVFCDFTIRELAGQIRSETVECLIGVNEFNEKIFLFIWFWLLFIILMTVLVNLYTFFTFNKRIFIRNLLLSVKENTTMSKAEKKDRIADFSDNYLKRDGQLVLSFVNNHSDVVAQEMADELFKKYMEWRNDNPMEKKMSDLLPQLENGDIEKKKMLPQVEAAFADEKKEKAGHLLLNLEAAVDGDVEKKE